MNPKKRKKLAVLEAKEAEAAVPETVTEVKVELKVEEAEQAVVESVVEVPAAAVKKTKKTV